MAQDDFVVKLPVGMEIDDNAAKDLSKQIDDIGSKLPELKIKVKSDAAKDITREIDHLVESLRKSGRMDFKVSLLGDDGADIRKVSVEYAELTEGIKKVIQQEYNLKDIRSKGVLLGQEWTEGSKAVVKYTQGVDEARAKTEANKRAMSELSAEIASVNKNLSKSEVEFARGNRNVSDLYFDDAAEKELQIRQKINALSKEGVITIGEAEQKERELGEAIKNTSEKAEVLKAKLADSQYNRDFKNLVSEQIKEQARIENERLKSQRLSASNYESWWTQALNERASLEKRILEELSNRERRNASNYINWWTQALDEVDSKREADDLSSKMTSWISSNIRLEDSGYFSSEINKLVEGLKLGKIGADDARAAFSRLQNEAKELGITGKTMGNQIVGALKDIANIATVTEIVYTLYNATRHVIQSIHELDDVMVDLQIASGASADEVKRMMDSYHDLARELGATSVEVAQAADGWLNKIGLPYRNMRLQFS